MLLALQLVADDVPGAHDQAQVLAAGGEQIDVLKRIAVYDQKIREGSWLYAAEAILVLQDLGIGRGYLS
jgi:hypothetical protein